MTYHRAYYIEKHLHNKIGMLLHARSERLEYTLPLIDILASDQD